MAIIQQIGAYAGLASVVGLAVLAGLYFSQARDVKRLREWAGRAPERAPGPYQPPYRPVAQPVRPPPRPPTGPGVGVQEPAPAQPAAAGAGPAVAAGPLAATPAAARAAESASAAAQGAVAHPPPQAPRPNLPPRAAPPGLGGHFAREAELARAREEAARLDGEPVPTDPDQQDGEPDGDRERPGEGERLEGERLEGAGTAEEHPEGAEPASEAEPLEEEDELDGEGDYDAEAEYDQESDPDAAALPDPEDFHEGDALVEDSVTGDQRAVAAPVRPPPPPITASRRPLPPRPAPPPRSGQPPLLPPYEESRPGGGSWETRRLSPAKAALAVGGTVAVVAAGAFGVLQLTKDDKGASPPAKSSSPAGANQPAGEKKTPGTPAVDPRSVTVSVLNGTTVGGLARQLGDKLEGQSFQLGNVTNNTDQQRAESVVLFAPGAEREAKEVGRRLKIDQREPIDPDSQTRAGDATVVVVTGADLNR